MSGLDDVLIPLSRVNDPCMRFKARALGLVDRGFNSWAGQTKDCKNGTYVLPAWHSVFGGWTWRLDHQMILKCSTAAFLGENGPNTNDKCHTLGDCDNHWDFNWLLFRASTAPCGKNRALCCNRFLFSEVRRLLPLSLPTCQIIFPYHTTHYVTIRHIRLPCWGGCFHGNLPSW